MGQGTREASGVNWIEIADKIEDGGFTLEGVGDIAFCSRCGLHEETKWCGGFNKLKYINSAFKPDIPRHHHRAVVAALDEIYGGDWFCTDCISDLMPYAVRLYEASLIDTELNKLKEAINERKRTENVGATAPSSGKYREGRSQQGSGCR